MKRVVLVCLLPSVVFAYSANPPNAKTGAPGEGTCRDCHASFGLNSGPGTLTLSVPEEFAPGGSYPIVVTIEQSGPTRWGFEFTPLAVGTCSPLDPVAVQIAVEGGKTYAKQTDAGTYAGSPMAAAWAFMWTAPIEAPDVVTFYACGNAANNNGSTSGDYVYTATAQTVRAQGVSDPEGRPADYSLTVWPNPLREWATIHYAGTGQGPVTLGIYDARGGLVWLMADEGRSVGDSVVRVDASGLPPGIYLCRLQASGATVTKPMVIVK